MYYRIDKMHNWVCNVLYYTELLEGRNTLCEVVSIAHAKTLELDKRNNCESMWLIYTPKKITLKADRI